LENLKVRVDVDILAIYEGFVAIAVFVDKKFSTIFLENCN